MNTKGTFLTGVTGTLGQEMLKTLLNQTGGPLFVLARANRRQSAVDRVHKLIANSGFAQSTLDRIKVLEGDVTEPGFGLKSAELQSLKQGARRFFHAAALTSLNGSQEDCEKINVGGTRHALEIAEQLKDSGCLEKFFYFSTAYAPGSRQRYHSFEDYLPVKPVFANFYESSKYQSETLVRNALAGNRIHGMIFRPSIVVGHSETGEVSQFNVIYPFMRLFAHGMLQILPTRLENSFNIVPIDYVVNASLAIAAQEDCLGKTFHLASLEPPTVGMLLEVKREDYPDVPLITIVDPGQFCREDLEPAQQFVYDMMAPYMGYLNDSLTFDCRNTAQALSRAGMSFPKTDIAFLRTLLRYAVGQGYLMIKSA